MSEPAVIIPFPEPVNERCAVCRWWTPELRWCAIGDTHTNSDWHCAAFKLDRKRIGGSE